MKSPLNATRAGNPRSTSSLAALRASPRHGPSLILPRLYLSNYAVAANRTELDTLGVTHIVSVLDFQPSGVPDHVKKLHVHLQDNSTAKILKHLEQTTAFIKSALEENESNIVLVHCLMGISRSATVVWAYVVATTSMNVDEALDFIIEKRSIVCPNLGFRLQMETYAANLCGKVEQSKEKTGLVDVAVRRALRRRRRKVTGAVTNARVI